MANSGSTFVPAYYATLTAFNNDNTVTENQVSWFDDVRQIYVGQALYPGAVTILGGPESFPAQASALVGVLYCKPSTMEIRRYTTTGYDVLVRPLTTVVNSSSTDDQLPTAKAVHSAVNTAGAAVQANLNTASGTLNTRITTVSSSLNASAAAKLDKLAAGSAGYVVQTNATGGIQYTSLPASRIADTNTYGSGFKSVAVDNGVLVMTRFNGAVQSASLGVTGLVTSTFFNPDDATLTIYTDTAAGGEVSSSVIDLSSLVDVYTGEGERAFNPAVGSEVAYLNYSDGMAVTSGSVVRNGDSFMLMTQAGTLTIGAGGPNLTCTALTVVTNLSAGIGPGAYVLLDSNLWRLTGAGNGSPASSYLFAGPTEVSVQGYKVHVGLNLHDGGHLVNSSGGLAVSAAGTVGNNTSLVTGAAIVTYGGSLLSSAGTAAQSKVNTASSALQNNLNTASSSLNAGISTASSALNSAKIDKVATGSAGFVALTTAAGGIQLSTFKPGGAALAATPAGTTLATELAVNSKCNIVSSGLNTAVGNASSTLNTRISTVSSTLTGAISSMGSASITKWK